MFNQWYIQRLFGETIFNKELRPPVTPSVQGPGKGSGGRCKPLESLEDLVLKNDLLLLKKTYNIY